MIGFSVDQAAGELTRVINSAPTSTPAQVRAYQRAAAERALRAAYEAGKREARGTREARPIRPITNQSKRPITTRQREALDIITDYIVEYRRPPTLREIGLRMGINSTNGVNDHLKALERKGYIEREPLASRGIRLASAPTPSVVEAMRVGEGTAWPLRRVLAELADAASVRLNECEPPLVESAELRLRGIVRAARVYAAGHLLGEDARRNDQSSDGVGAA